MSVTNVARVGAVAPSFAPIIGKGGRSSQVMAPPTALRVPFSSNSV